MRFGLSLATAAVLVGAAVVVAPGAQAEYCPPGAQLLLNNPPDSGLRGPDVCAWPDGHYTEALATVGPQVGDQPPQPQAPVTNAITLAFSPANIGSIVATVSNSSDLNASCHYSSQPIDSPRDFNVPAHGSTPLTFTGINAGINYTATVTCNDASGKQTVPLGSSTQNVKF